MLFALGFAQQGDGIGMGGQGLQRGFFALGILINPRRNIAVNFGASQLFARTGCIAFTPDHLMRLFEPPGWWRSPAITDVA